MSKTVGIVRDEPSTNEGRSFTVVMATVIAVICELPFDCVTKPHCLVALCFS